MPDLGLPGSKEPRGRMTPLLPLLQGVARPAAEWPSGGRA